MSFLSSWISKLSSALLAPAPRVWPLLARPIMSASYPISRSSLLLPPIKVSAVSEVFAVDLPVLLL